MENIWMFLQQTAAATLTALFLLINKNVLPSYLGSSFGFIAPIAAVTTAKRAASTSILV